MREGSERVQILFLCTPLVVRATRCRRATRCEQLIEKHKLQREKVAVEIDWHR